MISAPEERGSIRARLDYGGWLQLLQEMKSESCIVLAGSTVLADAEDPASLRNALVNLGLMRDKLPALFARLGTWWRDTGWQGGIDLIPVIQGMDQGLSVVTALENALWEFTLDTGSLDPEQQAFLDPKTGLPAQVVTLFQEIDILRVAPPSDERSQRLRDINIILAEYFANCKDILREGISWNLAFLYQLNVAHQTGSLSDFQKARDYGTRAVQLFKEAGHFGLPKVLRRLMYTQSKIVNLTDESSDWNLLENVLRQVISEYPSIPMTPHEVSDYRGIGLYLGSIGNECRNPKRRKTLYRRGIELIRRCHEAFESMGQLQEVTRSAASLGDIYLKLARLTKRPEDYLESIAFLRLAAPYVENGTGRRGRIGFWKLFGDVCLEAAPITQNPQLWVEGATAYQSAWAAATQANLQLMPDQVHLWDAAAICQTFFALYTGSHHDLQGAQGMNNKSFKLWDRLYRYPESGPALVCLRGRQARLALEFAVRFRRGSLQDAVILAQQCQRGAAQYPLEEQAVMARYVEGEAMRLKSTQTENWEELNESLKVLQDAYQRLTVLRGEGDRDMDEIELSMGLVHQVLWKQFNEPYDIDEALRLMEGPLQRQIADEAKRKEAERFKFLLELPPRMAEAVRPSNLLPIVLEIHNRKELLGGSIKDLYLEAARKIDDFPVPFKLDELKAAAEAARVVANGLMEAIMIPRALSILRTGIEYQASVCQRSPDEENSLKLVEMQTALGNQLKHKTKSERLEAAEVFDQAGRLCQALAKKHSNPAYYQKAIDSWENAWSLLRPKHDTRRIQKIQSQISDARNLLTRLKTPASQG